VAPEAARVSRALQAVVDGDPAPLDFLAARGHEELVEAATGLGVLTVPRAAVVAVLRRLLEKSMTPEQAQQWASFVRRGYIADPLGGPIRPLDIAFESRCEEAMADTISRLDEIGDVVDGVVTDEEARDLLRLLGEG
jgi:hypothetical protein